MASEPKDQGPRKEAVPDIVAPGAGQNATSNADSQITSAGFTVGTKSTTPAPSGESGKVDKVASQVIAAGEIKPLSTSIDYTYYSPHFPPYFPPYFPPFFPPFFPPHFPPHFT